MVDMLHLWRGQRGARRSQSGTARRKFIKPGLRVCVCGHVARAGAVAGVPQRVAAVVGIWRVRCRCVDRAHETHAPGRT